MWPRVGEHAMGREKLGDFSTLAARLDAELDANNSFAACPGVVNAITAATSQVRSVVEPTPMANRACQRNRPIDKNGNFVVINREFLLFHWRILFKAHFHREGEDDMAAGSLESRLSNIEELCIIIIIIIYGGGRGGGGMGRLAIAFHRRHKPDGSPHEDCVAVRAWSPIRARLIWRGCPGIGREQTARGERRADAAQVSRSRTERAAERTA